MDAFVAFLVAAVVLAVTPGPGMAYVIARTAAGGRSEGLASCAGTALGGMLHVMAAALGLSLLVAQSAVAFTAVKYVGAAYLVYLGVRMLLRKASTADPRALPAQGARPAFREGVVVEALNIKTALFFLAFLPQFMPTATSPALQVVTMGTICVVLNTVVDVLAVFAAQGLLHSQVARSARARILTRISGVTMIALGAWLALTRRSA